MIALLLAATRFMRGIRLGLKDPQFRVLLSVVVFLLILGTVFYSEVEKWRPLDSLYFSVTTLTTVGFGDPAPKTDLGKIFTIFYILVGAGTFVGFLAIVSQNASRHHGSDKKDK